MSANQQHIQAEQLRLLYQGITPTQTGTAIFACLLSYSIYSPSNAWPLLTWLGMLLALQLLAILRARYKLRVNQFAERPSRLRALVIIFCFIHGAAWGLLPWVALNDATVGEVALVAGGLAGIIGGGVTLLFPIWAAYLAFASAIGAMLGLRLLMLDDATYQTLGVATFVYAATLSYQARKFSQAALDMIELRFENTALIAQLRSETESANTAHQIAEQANLAKSKFLAAASHDLRQPIHAQGLFLHVLAHTPLSEVQHKAVTSAQAATEAASEMLNTLLDFSRIEAGVVRPVISAFSMQILLNKVENDLAPVANAKGIFYRSRETAATILSDATLVELILRNLVSNAIRYTEKGGVLIGCRRRGAHLCVEVWDTGIGIATAHQTDVFREFHQLGNPERDQRKGLGLGLAIADGLARTLGHTLSLQSTLGRGSVFRLLLPITTEATPPTSTSTSTPEIGATIPDGDSDYHHRLANLRVLVIDDDEAVRKGTASLLMSWGCVCVAAEDIDEALRLVRNEPPQFIISDFRLRENRTGSDAILALHACYGAHIPALLITGDSAPERLRESLASGVPLLHKPVMPLQLRQKMLLLLGRGV
jgi:two-component system, sensor histidine kinase